MLTDVIRKPDRYLKYKSAFMIALIGTLCIMTVFCHYMLSRAKNAQKNSIQENAAAYSSLMDERISVDLYGFLELNINPELESSALDDFFYDRASVNVSRGFSAVRKSAAECVEMADNLDGLILYRTSDNILLSTLSDYHYLAKINPAYPYLMSVIAQVNGDKPSFVYTSSGSLLYYYPIAYEETSAGNTSSHVSDCVIAILHRPEDFLEVNMSPSSSLATFAVLREGQVLSIEGYNPLSQNLVATAAGLARSTSLIYTYSDENLPEYYFYIIPSQTSELEYCYYEPVLTGWPLFQKAFSSWSLILLLLLLATALLFFILITTPPTKTHNKDNTDAEGTNESASLSPPIEENQFGTLPKYSGIIIDYRSRGSNPTTPETLALIDRTVRENFSFNKISYQASPQSYADCLEYHINYTNYNLRVFCDSLKMNLFNSVQECDINIFYGTAVSTYKEMEDELFYLRKHLYYSLITGYRIRLSIKQIQAFEENTEALDPDVTSTIQNFLRTGAYEDFYAYLNHYKEITAIYSHTYNFMTWYSYTERYRFAEEAFTTVKLFFQENSFSHPIVHATCNSVLQANPGFGNLCSYLISCVQEYQKENQHVLSDRNKQIMNTIYKFIDEDLANANLSTIARKMQMTDSHLSRVFKKNTGFNFSEYLTERRLEEAARLLVQETKLKVADISESLGYGNPTYFLSRFKAKYGMSPSAYRKAHLMEQAGASAPEDESGENT